MSLSWHYSVIINKVFENVVLNECTARLSHSRWRSVDLSSHRSWWTTTKRRKFDWYERVSWKHTWSMSKETEQRKEWCCWLLIARACLALKQSRCSQLVTASWEFALFLWACNWFLAWLSDTHYTSTDLLLNRCNWTCRESDYKDLACACITLKYLYSVVSAVIVEERAREINKNSSYDSFNEKQRSSLHVTRCLNKLSAYHIESFDRDSFAERILN